MTSNLQTIAKKLTESNNILIVIHARPDGDCLGSAYGLKLALAPRNVQIVCDDKIPPRLQFIVGGAEELAAPDDFEPDLIVAVDTAEYALMGVYGEKYNGKFDIKIDHHPMGSEYAELNYIDPESSASGEIIYELASAICDITPDIALPLFTAMVTDTGSFRYRNATAKTHRIAAELLDKGVNTAVIFNYLYSSRTQSEIRALGVAFSNLRYYFGGKVAVLNISNETKEANRLVDEDLGELNTIPRDVAGVELGITIKQKTDEPDKFKVSMRSGENVDASLICGALGGGGHMRASGALVEAVSPDEAEKIIINAAAEVLGTEFTNASEQ